MTNYNDGNWHGWNGGECPVPPKSKVEVVIRDTDGLIRLEAGNAGSFRWERVELYANIIAFRVVEEYREPREWWIGGGQVWLLEETARQKNALYGGELIHVREVLE